MEASLAPAQNENLHIRGKEGASKADLPRPSRAGRHERKALRDLSSKPSLSSSSSATAAAATKSAAAKKKVPQALRDLSSKPPLFSSSVTAAAATKSAAVKKKAPQALRDLSSKPLSSSSSSATAAAATKSATAKKKGPQALRDLSSKPLSSSSSSSSATAAAATKSAAENKILFEGLTEEELDQCRLWAEEGIEQMHYFDYEKHEREEMQKLLNDEVESVTAGLRGWMDMTFYGLGVPPKEIPSDDEDVLKLEVEPEVLLPKRPSDFFLQYSRSNSAPSPKIPSPLRFRARSSAPMYRCNTTAPQPVERIEDLLDFKQIYSPLKNLKKHCQFFSDPIYEIPSDEEDILKFDVEPELLLLPELPSCSNSVERIEDLLDFKQIE